MMEDIYCNVIYTGVMGTALIPKVLSNMLTCVYNQAMGEVFMIGKRAGVDMRTMWDCIRASSGNSFVWETGGPMLMQGTYDPSFSIALQCKDNRWGSMVIITISISLTGWDTKLPPSTGFRLRFSGTPCRHTTRPCTPTVMRLPATPHRGCWRRLWVLISG